ncbi:hypothetical protein Verru16b_01647 [Lacunisphaera limnophila]|uniref:Cupin domain protein n=1 Tax=Lacunisphaera limnophila TaxID=1838286 RepID=A0A1D8AUM0_9BACT|nr:hypothetical protein [Lacunisphaera limnophila]AOS44584.1 hypothetical protein Verru16b_01647 [Lacunisphaera limnophila]
MNSSLTTLELPSDLLQISPVLKQRGFTCSLLTLAPDTETRLPASPSPDDQLLFVITGDIAIHAEGLTTIVNQGGACLLKPVASPVLSARAGAPSRVLRVEIPPRQVITPQIITPRA